MSAIAGPIANLIRETDVHVWRIDLDRGDEQGLLTMLSPDELARAARFYFDRDRRRFVVARAALRCILADYLELLPAEMTFLYGRHGKPALPSPWSDLRFNLSHSDGIGLCAVTWGREVGVDVERIRPLDDLETLAEQVFSRRERETLQRLTGSQKPNGFFNAWTRKEAFIKALGEGLSHPLDRFDVSLAPTAPPRLERIDGDPMRAARWWLSAVAIDAEHAAAVVVEGRNVTLVGRRWPQDLAGERHALR